MDENIPLTNKLPGNVFKEIADKVTNISCLKQDETYECEDDSGNIRLKINQRQMVLSLDISPLFLHTASGAELSACLCGISNRAIQQTNGRLVNELLDAVNIETWAEMLSIAESGTMTLYRRMKGKYDELFQELGEKIITVASTNGNVVIDITGSTLVRAIEFREGWVTGERKSAIEEEVKDTLNQGIRAIQDVINLRIKGIENASEK
jgi:DNA-binding protein YbaB